MRRDNFGNSIPSECPKASKAGANGHTIVNTSIDLTFGCELQNGRTELPNTGHAANWTAVELLQDDNDRAISSNELFNLRDAALIVILVRAYDAPIGGYKRSFKEHQIGRASCRE